MIDIIANGLKPVNDKSKDNKCFFIQISGGHSKKNKARMLENILLKRFAFTLKP